MTSSLWSHGRAPTLLGLGLRLVRAARRGRVHVLMVLETGGGGAARHVIDLSRGLIERGYCVTLAYSALRAEASFLDEIRSVHELQRVEIDMTREVSVTDIDAARALRAYMLEFGPFQFIHGHSSKGGALSRLAAVGTEAARIYTPHAFVTLNPRLDGVQRLVYSTAERTLSYLADAIICVSREEYDHALQIRVDPTRLHLVPNGVAPLPAAERSAIRRQLGLEDSQVCIGYVGRLDAGKAVDRLVQAFAYVHGHVPSARLAVVGSGPQEQALRNQSARLNVAHAVTFLGRAHGPTLGAGFDVFAFASLYEGFPYALLEAARRGLPIVTTQVGGANQIVSDGITGFVVPQDDGARFARCLVRLCIDKALRDRMAAATIGLIEQWTAQRMIDDTIKVYSAAEHVRQESAKRHGPFRSLHKA
jgi:glycosyltransferase involved in cell wall biosynthesis